MKKIFVAAAALTMIGGAASAQTPSPTGTGPASPSVADQQQRCMQLPDGAARQHCLDDIRPGAGANTSGRPTTTTPAEQQQGEVPRNRDPQSPRDPMAAPPNPMSPER